MSSACPKRSAATSPTSSTPGSECPAQLGTRLQDADVQIFELTESLADAREELDTVREINRELLADQERA